MAQQQKSRRKHSQYYWQVHIRKHEESGLPRAEYCRQHNITCHTLAYWERKLSQPPSKPTALVPVPIEKMIRYPVRNQGAGVKILLNNNVSVELTEQFSSVALNRVLSVLEQR